MIELLSPSTVGAYLVDRGVLTANADPEIVELGGGVSNVVLAVRSGETRVVVKQALPRLRVEEEWLAPSERAVAEAEALQLADRLAPGSVPSVLDADSKRCALVVAEAPDGWGSWKELLLEGEADARVAARLGALLARVHSATADRDPRIGSAEAFESLRVDPYLRTIMHRHAELAPVIGAYVERLLATNRCLVHGDYSPKNVLVGDGGVWVIDWEVAHRGDPAFDLAFMLNHLLLKTIHRSTERAAYETCGEAFLDAYGGDFDARYVFGLTGCLMLARVDGKSPAEYLTEDGRRRARARGSDLLAEPPGSIAEMWSRIGT